MMYGGGANKILKAVEMYSFLNWTMDYLATIHVV